MLNQERKPLPPDHRIVLDWLAKQPAKVFDFADIAEALKMKRGKVEDVIVDLKHQRFGAPLALVAPDGTRLRARHAFLPHDSVARTGYAPVEPADDTAAEHPTLVEQRRAREEQARKDEEAREEARLAGLARAEAHHGYRKRKLEAREKAADETPRRGDHFVTGYSEVAPLGGDTVDPNAPTTAAAAATARAPSAKAASAKANKRGDAAEAAEPMTHDQHKELSPSPTIDIGPMGALDPTAATLATLDEKLSHKEDAAKDKAPSYKKKDHK